MKTIIEKTELIIGLLGNQEIVSDEKYRKLQFVELCEFDGAYLAYNMLTRELCKLSKTEWEALNASDFSYADDVKDLITHWFAVSLGQNDVKLYNQVLNLHNMFDHEDYLDFYTILTTTNCNARCFYCYEKGMKHVDMTEETALEVADFIVLHAKGRKVKLSWFGGEPLYNMGVIDIITDKLSSAGVEFTSTMISNGYLFDSNVIDRAKNKWRLKRVQITLDGTRDVYNRAKNYIYQDTNPFERVCNNVGELLKNDIMVKIRLNMDAYNQDNLYELGKQLFDRFGSHKKLQVYIALLFDFDHKRDTVETLQLVTNALQIEKAFQEKGILRYGLGGNKFKSNYCMADSRHAVVINPEGKLAKCEHYSDEDALGTIKQPNLSPSGLAWEAKHNDLSGCETCAYYIECRAPRRCVSFMSKCEEFDRTLRSTRMKRAMISAYQNKKEPIIDDENNC